MAGKIIWSPHAVNNLEDICHYIERDSRYYASIFAQRIVQKIQALADFPESGRIVPEYKNDSLREIFQGNYRIIYRIHPFRIEIVAIIHGARLLK